jgi:hypothetical protein
VIPAPYGNFLLASTQASAALIGLLFVSVSIAPERVFGSRAEAGRQALALSSFTALANVFFISFGSLIPNIPLGPLVVVPGLVAGSQTLFLLALIPRWRREGGLYRGLTALAISVAVYVYEIAVGFRLWFVSVDAGSLTTLLELMLGTYAIGLGRAWQLLGAPLVHGVAGAAIDWLRTRRNAAGHPSGRA